jgi:hypothetical protein
MYMDKTHVDGNGADTSGHVRSREILCLSLCVCVCVSVCLYVSMLHTHITCMATYVYADITCMST